MADNGENSGTGRKMSGVPTEPTSPTLNMAESCTYTQANLEKFSHMWTIDNFSLRCKGKNESLESSTFPSERDGKLKWCLELEFETGESRKVPKHLSLYLHVLNNPKEVLAKFKFSILNDEGKEIKSWTCEGHQFKFGEGRRHGYGYYKLISLDDLLDKLIDDKVIIFCEGHAIAETTSHFSHSSCTPVKVPEARLSDDMGNILDKATFSDVTLCAQGREFQVHKNVLSGRSPVFCAMFEHPLQESTSNRVDIPDIDQEVLSEMLQFMYTGKAPNLDTMAADLLTAADKYQLERLKVMCEESMCKTVTVDNVCEVLALADLHSAIQLKQHAIDFINGNASDVKATQGWKTMVTNQPHLIIAAFDAITSQKKPSVVVEPPTKRIKLT